MSVLERIWYADDIIARATRALLSPAEFVFGAAVRRRNERFDREIHRFKPHLPAVSVGNLTVGGTGKTPMAAWCVQQLRARGASPAVVMRGYGDDEWRVHTLLNPGTQVVVSADRVGGVVTARTRGADCVVLDDAFQHRRVPRVVDMVLVSVDTWSTHTRLLPAGPFREPLASLRRASVIVLTCKSGDASSAAHVGNYLRQFAPDVPQAWIRIVPQELRLAASIGASGQGTRDRTGFLRHAPSWLRNRRIVSACAIGNPRAFEAQLTSEGAELVRRHRFRDHHQFRADDVRRIVRDAERTDGVVCTLKDAVKLTTLWPREGPPLWYVSQAVLIDRGAEALDQAMGKVLAARTIGLQTTR